MSKAERKAALKAAKAAAKAEAKVTVVFPVLESVTLKVLDPRLNEASITLALILLI